MSYFLVWWDKFYAKLGDRVKKLPDDMEDFVYYLNRAPINLQSKQEIVRLFVKGRLGIEFKRSKRNMQKYRRALRAYEEFREKTSMKTTITFAPAYTAVMD